MKVKELIKALKGLNPDAEVYSMEAKSGEWQIVEDAEFYEKRLKRLEDE